MNPVYWSFAWDHEENDNGGICDLVDTCETLERAQHRCLLAAGDYQTPMIEVVEIIDNKPNQAWWYDPDRDVWVKHKQTFPLGNGRTRDWQRPIEGWDV